MTFVDFFIDPLYRAPVIGSMLMCLAAALMGTLMFVKRQSLVGETLSHATYPGVVLSVIVGALFFSPTDTFSVFIVLVGAFLFSYLGLEALEKLQSRLRIHIDAALCLVLSIFLGFGVLLASRIQFSHPLWYQKSLVFIYGQAATMTDTHIAVYGILSLAITFFIIFRFQEIQLALFDSSYAKSRRLHIDRVTKGIFFLLILSIVVGIRSVGVILMSGMLLAPAAAARCYTDRFSRMLILSAFFGLLSAFLGNYLSIKWSSFGFTFPTGPMILLVGVFLTLSSLIFAPQRGALSRLFRISAFRQRCLSENILKTLWKGETPLGEEGILKWNDIRKMTLKKTLFNLRREGWIEKNKGGKIMLTPDGVKRAARLVRLHRLWELYLVSCLKVDEERVHRSAEEMEHILTPSLESRLSLLLNHPKKDPHQKPIPQGDF